MSRRNRIRHPRSWLEDAAEYATQFVYDHASDLARATRHTVFPHVRMSPILYHASPYSESYYRPRPAAMAGIRRVGTRFTTGITSAARSARVIRRVPLRSTAGYARTRRSGFTSRLVRPRFRRPQIRSRY